MSTAFYRENEQIVSEQSHCLTLTAAVYLSLPVILFVMSWLNTGAAMTATLLIAYAIITCISLQKSTFWSSVLGICRNNLIALAVLLFWCGLSGTGGVGFQNTDYAASNALLKDLIENSWPLRLHGDVPLVYYVFYYLPAAAVGKLLGWQSANVFLFFWTYFGVALLWCLLSLAMKLDTLSPIRKWMALTAFILFGGWDYFGALLNYGPSLVTPGTHIEWWAHIGQFSSNTTLLFWVPQHVIAPWIVTAMIVLQLQRNLSQHAIWFMAAVSFLWSPLASLGLLPFLAIMLFHELKAGLWARSLNVTNAFVAPVLALMGYLFYSSNAFKFPSEWLFEEPGFTRNYSLLTMLETVAIALPFFTQHMKSKIYLNQLDLPPPEKLSSAEKALGWSALATLIVLPTFKLGIMNDLCMRASVPSLLVLFAFSVRILRKEFTYQQFPLVTQMICIILGSGSAIHEIQRSLRNYSIQVPDKQNVSTLLNSPDNQIIQQRAGRKDSLFWKWLGPHSE